MSEGEGLQFDKAEFENAPAHAQCAQCHRDLIGSYYEVEGQTVCEACKYTIESRMTEGSGAGRFVRATGAGLVAAALGAALYYAITAISGYEFGLIAIVVGFGVGTAVRWGSNGRGGKRYQALAMALTYLAIVATYIPPIIQGFREGAAETAAVEPAVAADESPIGCPGRRSSAVRDRRRRRHRRGRANRRSTDGRRGRPDCGDCVRGAVPRRLRERHRHRDHRHRVVRGLEAEPAHDGHDYRPARDRPLLGGNDWRMNLPAEARSRSARAAAPNWARRFFPVRLCRRLVHA